MINYLYGLLESKSTNNIIIDINGIGYFVTISVSTFSKLPESGNSVKIFIVETVSGLYGGIISLYGFLSKEERDLYLLIKDEVPGTGAKKAMEYFDKVSKSFSDFKNAIIAKNSSALVSVFGFTKKTADKLIVALKDKIPNINTSDNQKWPDMNIDDKIVSDAIGGLVNLGYKEQQVKAVVKKVYEQNEKIYLENLIKESLRDL
jgi:Holliday junction DNA helicase RuvA